MMELCENMECISTCYKINRDGNSTNLSDKVPQKYL